MVEQKINKLTVLIVSVIAVVLTPIMGSSINVALPAIAQELSANAILLSWITTGFFLVSAMVAIPLGRIADIYGLKKIFTCGVVIFTTASLLGAISPTVEFLIIARGLQGVGSAMILVTGMAIITSAFPPRERGKVIGINITVLYMGLAIGPVIGGLFTQYLGWRSLFYLMLPFGILILSLILWKLKGIEWAVCKGENFDKVGSIVFSISLLLVLWGFSMITSTPGKLMVLMGIAGFILFVVYELRIEHPVLDMKLFFHNRMFAFSNLSTLISFTGTFAVVFLLSLYLQYIKGLSPISAGLILAISTIFMALMSTVSGKLSDKYDPRKIASVGMMIITLSLFMFIFLDKNTCVYYLLLGLILMGIGSGTFSSPNTNAIMSSVEPRFYGVAAATSSTMRITGQTLSMGITILIFSIYIGTAQFTPSTYPELMTSIKVIFVISTIMGFGAIFASLARN
jgi:EmrB/QacA subfamily drug resistance transporter